ncbi:MAG: spermidine synthase [Actinomycetaceae bacterium]|nr:spermidine synthase [Actinomycetaceae bacterium]
MVHKQSKRVRRQQSESIPTSLHTGMQLAEVKPWGRGQMLYLDGAESSYLDADPSVLEFEYHQHMNILAHSQGRVQRGLHLGGAGCALARSWVAAWPGSEQVAVEVDAKLADMVRLWFVLPRAPALRIRVGDATEVIGAVRPGSFTAVVRDVFAQSQVPAAVLGKNFAADCLRAVGTDGFVAYNLTSSAGWAQVRAEVGDLRGALDMVGQDFREDAVTELPIFGPQLVAIADPRVMGRARKGNIVLGARYCGWDIEFLERECRKLALPARMYFLRDF